MRCPVCGYENTENKNICPVCNSPINDLGEAFVTMDDMFVVESDELPQKGVLTNMLNALASSRILKFAVVFQMICIVFDALLFSHILGNVKNYMIATNALEVNSPKIYSLIVNTGLVILIIPMILSVVGILVCIFSSAVKNRVSPIGVKIFNVSKCLEMVMVLCGIVLIIVAQFGEGGMSTATSIVVLINVMFLVFAAFYYIGMISSVKRILYSMENDEPTESLSGSLIVCSIAFALFCLAISSIGFFGIKNIILGLWGLPFAVSEILYAMFIKKYNSAMEWLYQESWNESN